MKYDVETSLQDFHFWSGGKSNAKLLTNNQMDMVEDMLEDMEPSDGWTDTGINDLFWFEFDVICDWLGYDSEEHLKQDLNRELVQEIEEWGEELSTDYQVLFAITHLDIKDYYYQDEDGETTIDWDRATEDFKDWWENLDDFEKADFYRNNH